MHARCARWGIYPAAGFFFFCAVFTNALVLLNLARAVVIHSYIQTDAQFWHRRPDDVTREPMNLIHYIRQPYEEYRDMMRMRKFRKSQVKGYAMELSWHPQTVYYHRQYGQVKECVRMMWWCVTVVSDVTVIAAH